MPGAMTAQRSLIIERLCAHHRVDQFESGSGPYDEMIRVAAKATTTASENDQFFVAHHGDNLTIGFLAIGEMTVEVDGRHPANGLLISGLAIDLSVQNVAVIRGLLRKASAVRVAKSRAKSRAKSYQFEAALVSENERIEAVLERAGFTRHEDAFWVRPIAR
jgi:hypothetical protein